jgi:hypothetical protein
MTLRVAEKIPCEVFEESPFLVALRDRPVGDPLDWTAIFFQSCESLLTIFLFTGKLAQFVQRRSAFCSTQVTRLGMARGMRR